MNNCTRFSDIFWIDASSESNIELGLTQIAEAYNITPGEKPSARSALQWMSKRTKWLIVYDGADVHYSVVEKFLPSGNGGNILMTSRNVGLKRLASKENSAEVLDMTDEEGVTLLLQSAMIDDSSENTQDIAKKLVSELGRIPLALDQAGAYMHSCSCSIKAYLDLYTKHRDLLMSGPEFRGASDYGTSAYGTWEVSMHEIETMAMKGTGMEALAAQSAIKLWKIFAFLNHENIPEQLFKNATENHIMKILEGAINIGLPFSAILVDDEALFLSEELIWDRLSFLHGIQTLLSFSLIKSHNQLYSAHLLVHAWSRSRIPGDNVANLYQRARALLSCSVGNDHGARNYMFCKLLAPHIRSCFLYASELNLKTTYYDDEYKNFSFVFDCVGSWNERENLLLVTVTERNRRLGHEHSLTLSSMSDLASTYNDQGRWDEAEKLEIEVMTTGRKKLESNNPIIFTSMMHLANIYNKQGRWTEAEKVQQEALSAIQATLGPDHQYVLIGKTNLSTTYRHQGRWDEAEKLQVEVMNAMKAEYGSNHLHTLSSIANLTSTYAHQGKWSEAEKLQIEVTNVKKAILGTDHPNTHRSMSNLAAIYLRQGRWYEAEKLQEAAMDEMMTKIGPNHPQSVTNMSNLASTYWKQGRWGEAVQLHSEVLDVTKKKFGLDHPETLTSMNNLASTYGDQGRWEEAKNLQVKVLAMTRAKLGSSHPLTLSSMANLAIMYRDLGKWNEAEKLQVEVMQAMS